MRAQSVLLPAAIALLVVGPVTDRTEAQSIWLEPAADRELCLEILKPAFPEESFLAEEYSTFTLTYFLSGRFASGETTRFVFELPLSHAAIEGSELSDTTIGNLYAGVEFGRTTGGVQSSVGIRLPMASETNVASVVGAFADYVDRFEAFVPNVMTVTASIGNKHRTTPGFGIGGRIAPLVWIDTGGALNDGAELFLLYHLMAWYEGAAFGLGGGFSGRLLALRGRGEFSERTNHQLGLFARFALDRWRPGIQVRVPLDEGLKRTVATQVSLSVGLMLE